MFVIETFPWVMLSSCKILNVYLSFIVIVVLIIIVAAAVVVVIF